MVGEACGIRPSIIIHHIPHGALVVGEAPEDVADHIFIGEDLIDRRAVQVAVCEAVRIVKDQNAGWPRLLATGAAQPWEVLLEFDSETMNLL